MPHTPISKNKFLEIPYRYISENLTQYLNEAGDTDFDYAKLSDEEAESSRDDMVRTKGFFILPSELFCKVIENAKNDENRRFPSF